MWIWVASRRRRRRRRFKARMALTLRQQNSVRPVLVSHYGDAMAQRAICPEIRKVCRGIIPDCSPALTQPALTQPALKNCSERFEDLPTYVGRADRRIAMHATHGRHRSLGELGRNTLLPTGVPTRAPCRISHGRAHRWRPPGRQYCPSASESAGRRQIDAATMPAPMKPPGARRPSRCPASCDRGPAGGILLKHCSRRPLWGRQPAGAGGLDAARPVGQASGAGREKTTPGSSESCRNASPCRVLPACSGTAFRCGTNIAYGLAPWPTLSATSCWPRA